MNKSLVYLQETASGALIEASLFDEVGDEHLRLWEHGWVPEMRLHLANHSAAYTPEDSHWDWRNKADSRRTLLGYQSCALVCEGELQGLMLTNDMTSARLPQQFGRPIVYVEFLATAPWNRPVFRSPPKYRGSGRIFILAAIQTSIDAGFKGRIGLHSLPAAEGFYEDKCGFTRLGPDSSHQNLTYYEMTDTQADAFRRNH
jgi:hypothetical protein